MPTSQALLHGILPWALVTSVIGACQPADDAAAPLADDRPADAPRLAGAEHGPLASVVHDGRTPGAASLAGGEALTRRTRPPRTSAEIAESHRTMLREALARAPVRLELPANVRWTFEAAPGTHAGAYLVTSAEPLAACGADGPVKVRVPYHSELDLAVDAAHTLLVLGHAGADGVESALVTPWDGRSIVSPKSAAPVPLARTEVFGDCPQG